MCFMLNFCNNDVVIVISDCLAKEWFIFDDFHLMFLSEPLLELLEFLHVSSLLAAVFLHFNVLCCLLFNVFLLFLLEVLAGTASGILVTHLFDS